MARQQARRRHRERLTGIILAVLGVVVLVVAAIAISEPKSHTDNAAAPASSTAPASTPVPTPSKTPTPTPSRSTATPGPSLSLGGSTTPTGSGAKVPLVVLNNTTTNGLATDAAQAFRDKGWTVTDVGNLQNEIISSCAYYDPDVAGAEAAAKALRDEFPGIRRVVEKFSDLPSGPVVVVLTSDYSGG